MSVGGIMGRFGGVAMRSAGADVGSGTLRSRPRLSVCVVAVGLVAVLAGAVVASPVAAQDRTGGDEVRIVARKLADGRIEFGLQQRQTDSSWADRQLPSRRFFPPTAGVDRWLASAPLTLESSSGEEVVRILARKLEDGRVEFGLQQRGTGATWADRQLPTRRFFPTTATVGSWLASSPLTFGATSTTPPTAQDLFTAVTSGGGHSCGLRTDGAAICWGSNYYGEAEAPLEQFSAITAGADHSCGLRTDDTVTCWGANRFGQADAPSGQFTAVSVGEWHSCGLRTDGTVTCWGANDPDSDLGQTDAPSGQFTAVSVGGVHSCGLRTDGTVTCWGANDPDSDLGQTDAPSGQFIAVSAGGVHSCGLRTNGTITCWGANDPNANDPTWRGHRRDQGQADAPSGQFTAIASGVFHSCGLRTNGTITCWGSNVSAPSGQFTAVTHSCALRNNGTIACWGTHAAAIAPTGQQFTAVTVGGPQLCLGERCGSHSCGLRNDGTVTCWGANNSGQAALPSGQFTAVTAGANHSCGLRSNGTAYCWGANHPDVDHGQTDVPSGQFTAVTAGGAHSCGLRANGTITCWGADSVHVDFGQTDAPSGQFSAVSAGGEHSCGLRTNGTITCWGWNRLGQTNAPRGQFTFVSAGGEHSCALRTNGTITCWGNNGDGQADSPVGQFTAIAAGRDHSCGLRSNGTVICWGNTASGKPTRRAGNSPPSPPATSTHARFAPTARSSVVRASSAADGPVAGRSELLSSAPELITACRGSVPWYSSRLTPRGCRREWPPRRPATHRLRSQTVLRRTVEGRRLQAHDTEPQYRP